MRPLIFQGVGAAYCHDQLQAFLAQHRDFLVERGMDDPEAFLAEPVHDPGGLTDWYMPGDTEPAPLASLPPEEQDAVRQKLACYARALGELLENASRPGQQESMAAGLLREALHCPTSDDIYVCDGKPVLINWGFAAGEQGSVPEDIMRHAEHPEPPVKTPLPVQEPETPPAGPGSAGLREAGPPPPGETSAPLSAAAPIPEKAALPAGPAVSLPIAGCLPWLLPAFLALLLLWLLLAIAGLFPSPLPSGCFRQTASLENETLRGRQQQDTEARLLGSLAERAALCRPAAPLKKAEPEREAVMPDMPAPAPEPPREEPRPVPVIPKGHDIEIPQDAARDKDLSFLEGCWESTGLVNSRTNEPVIWEYCFNKKGVGTRKGKERSGRTCSGSARASFRGDRLAIRTPRAPCSDGNAYAPQNIECQGKGSSTQCRGVERSSRESTTWKTRFRRR